MDRLESMSALLGVVAAAERGAGGSRAGQP
jgi:hypothetical protein